MNRISLSIALLFANTLLAQTRPADTWVSTKPESPVVLGAKLQRLAGGFTFTEGPTSDNRGNIFFIDQPNDRIMRWSVGGGTANKLSPWMQPSGHSTGRS